MRYFSHTKRVSGMKINSREVEEKGGDGVKVPRSGMLSMKVFFGEGVVGCMEGGSV